MTIIKFPSRKNESAFLSDIKEDGYQEKAKVAVVPIWQYLPRDISSDGLVDTHHVMAYLMLPLSAQP